MSCILFVARDPGLCQLTLCFIAAYSYEKNFIKFAINQLTHITSGRGRLIFMIIQASSYSKKDFAHNKVSNRCLGPSHQIRLISISNNCLCSKKKKKKMF